MNRKAFTLIEVSVVIGVFLIMFACLMPVVRIVKERAERINCAKNLMTISLGLHAYAADHNEEFPPSLAALYPDYIKDEKAFDCPASKPIGSTEKPDYIYVAGLTESSPPTEVMVYDLDDNHKTNFRNILRINGTVERVRKAPGKPR